MLRTWIGSDACNMEFAAEQVLIVSHPSMELSSTMFTYFSSFSLVVFLHLLIHTIKQILANLMTYAVQFVSRKSFLPHFVQDMVFNCSASNKFVIYEQVRAWFSPSKIPGAAVVSTFSYKYTGLGVHYYKVTTRSSLPSSDLHVTQLLEVLSAHTRVK